MRIFYRTKVVLIIILLLCIAPNICAQEVDKAWLISKFNELALVINNGEGYSNSTNEAGALAWAQSYLLEAYLDMYEATKDKKYIDKFVIQADRVYKNTDKARGIKDYKGRSRIGWSATKYSKNKEPMVHIVHSGMILCPLVKFSLMVKYNKELVNYMDVADKFIKFTEEAVAEFENQWRFDTKTGEGSYWFEGDEPIGADLKAPMPFNGSLAMGRVLILLYKLTDKETYLDKAKALAWHFKNNLIETDKDSYIWGYRPNIKKYPKVEDISHGAIDVDFAVQAYRVGIVFDKTDLERFSKTLIATKKNGKFSIYVDGKDDEKIKEDYSDASGRWLELSHVNCELYKVVYDYMTNRVKESKKEHPQVMLGMAKLIKHWEKCR